MPIVVVREAPTASLRAFYNVCKHRAHELVQGEGTMRNLVCPVPRLDLRPVRCRLTAARHTGHLADFDRSSICLDQVQVTEFGGFVFVNLDPGAEPLDAASLETSAPRSPTGLPDIADLTFAHRLTYTIASNWKNVVDNFLECYHCHVAHRDFVSLVDMDTYTVTTHGIYSSHMAEAGKGVKHRL